MKMLTFVSMTSNDRFFVFKLRHYLPPGRASITNDRGDGKKSFGHVDRCGSGIQISFFAWISNIYLISASPFSMKYGTASPNAWRMITAFTFASLSDAFEILCDIPLFTAETSLYISTSFCNSQSGFFPSRMATNCPVRYVDPVRNIVSVGVANGRW